MVARRLRGHLSCSHLAWSVGVDAQPGLRARTSFPFSSRSLRRLLPRPSFASCKHPPHRSPKFAPYVNPAGPWQLPLPPFAPVPALPFPPPARRTNDSDQYRTHPRTGKMELQKAFTSATRTVSSSSLRERLSSLSSLTTTPLRPVANLHAHIECVSPLWPLFGASQGALG